MFRGELLVAAGFFLANAGIVSVQGITDRQ